MWTDPIVVPFILYYFGMDSMYFDKYFAIYGRISQGYVTPLKIYLWEKPE